jgi:hypothetical protein
LENARTPKDFQRIHERVPQIGDFSQLSLEDRFSNLECVRRWKEYYKYDSEATPDTTEREWFNILERTIPTEIYEAIKGP